MPEYRCIECGKNFDEEEFLITCKGVNDEYGAVGICDCSEEGPVVPVEELILAWHQYYKEREEEVEELDFSDK